MIDNLERKIEICPFFEINNEIIDYILEIKKDKIDKKKYEEWYNKLTKYISQYEKSIKVYEQQKKKMVGMIMELSKDNSYISSELLNDIKNNKNLSLDEYNNILNTITNEQNKIITIKSDRSTIRSKNEIMKSPYICLYIFYYLI